jgi:hypothetical protein
MTGSIEDELLASLEFNSLKMENEVSNSFLNCERNALRGRYYKDADQGKNREIDVHCEIEFFEPKNEYDFRITTYTFCECKSLKGSNIIFSAANEYEMTSDVVNRYWIGNHATEVVQNIARQINGLELVIAVSRGLTR